MEIKEYFENYTKFIDSVTADISKHDEMFLPHFESLSAKLNGNFTRLDNAITGLVGESGEVLDVWKKTKYHGLEFKEAKERFIKELGDVCWYLFQTAYALGVPVNEIIDANIEKLKKRHANGFSSEYMHKKGA